MDLSAKFSLYDVLAMIIPGGIIMAAIILLFNPDLFQNECTTCFMSNITINDLGIIQSVVLLSISYVLGLLNNWISDGVFRGFRNNHEAIENELLRVLRHNENIYLKSHGVNRDRQTKSQVKNLLIIIGKVSKNIMMDWLKWIPCIKKNNMGNHTVYHSLYYKLYDRKLLGAIPFIESQVALLRNSLIPLVALIVAFYIHCEDTCLLWSLLVVILLYITMIQRQNKIYRLVWESANYLEL
ncbi:MAG: hypothetical protein K2G41_10880 [Duncaniella sp.]|uniref:hypothetical protein n=1 Tax=Duncaniella sp. TaxID=2518496 RepID=UPI0023CF2BD7|nr:hypothetical protein [Duncaniella sp.]MDE6091189.1 hypothetical protein [Duncaniella sp.]